MKNLRFTLGIIIGITVVSILIDLPRISINLKSHNFEIGGYNLDFYFFGKRVFRDLSLRQGLDISGGTHIVLEADMQGIEGNDRESALEAASEVIRRRVDLFGVAEPVIQTSRVKDSYRIVVELAGISNIDQAVDLIGQTAHLSFMELNEDIEYTREKFSEIVLNFNNWIDTGVTGADLKGADVVFGGTQQSLNEPQIRIKFTSEGRRKFSEVAKRNVEKPVGIFLDGVPLSIPEISPSLADGITDDPVITGQFTPEDANNLAIQIRAGALPVPVKIIGQRNVGATLGLESVQKSIIAGSIGLILVLLFMIFYYGRLGVLASVALIIYGLVTFAIYKIIPVTLTLAGISGFLLSVGMAVDSNILIFERIKEELRAGAPKNLAMELGFGRAWDSIRDANVATLITCFILFNPFNWEFLNTSGIVRGFALTLTLGILVSLFTGIIVTRTLVRVFFK